MENKMNIFLSIRSVMLGIILLAAPSVTSEDGYSSIFQALTNPNRPQIDFELDPLRKPEHVLKFFGIKPHMNVLDVFAGSGYYTELISYLVGQSGSVTMHNHVLWQPYFKKDIDIRFTNKKLSNVEYLVQDINKTQFNENKYDVAIIILGLHDLYAQNQKSSSDEPFNIERFLKSIFNSIKAGGTLGVVEHNALQGSKPSVSAQLHRLDKNYIIKLMNEIGFVLEANSSMLTNAEDDLTKSVFTPALRRKTDRAVLKFRKPLVRHKPQVEA